MDDTVGSIHYDAHIDTSNLKSDGAKADAIVSDTGDKIEKTGEKSFGAFSKWAKVGVLAAATATTLLGTAAFKTGIEYNTLQQTSRAALKTILGSTEAANKQMDELNTFVKNSPFGKDIFIRSQQQLLGFGVAAGKVIPALDAVQNAVAAVGGSGEQISGIVDVLSDIQSTGRVTGQEFQRLGFFGIDAAKLIGDQMGLTSEQIKEMASKPGGLPVDKIWDPLVNGLQDKFGGAADNVKNTFAGTVDRVKAAFRDLSASVFSVFVNPNGGGAAVEWGNKLATFLRHIQADIPGFIESVKKGFNIIAEAIKPLTDYIANNKQAWEGLKIIVTGVIATFAALVVGLIVGVLAAFAVIQFAVQRLYQGIQLLVDIFIGFIDVLTTVASAISNFAVSAWNTISKLVTNIKNVFLSLPGFFSNLWQSITSLFSSVGTTVGNALGNAFKGVINSVLSGAAKVINTFVDALNGAVGAINKVPGVNIGKVSRVSVPQLAKGGIVSSPTLAMVGEGRESEAIIPLSKLDDMINQQPQGPAIENNIGTIVVDSQAREDAIIRRLTLNQETVSNGLVPKQAYA